MVPFQPAHGRQGKGQPSNSGTYRSVNILHSFSASKNSSAGHSQSESLWLETTDKRTGLRRSDKSPKSAVRTFPLVFSLALPFPSLLHTEGWKTHLFKLILSTESQVFSLQVALTEVFSVCQNILKNCLPALVVLCTQHIKSRFQKRSSWSLWELWLLSISDPMSKHSSSHIPLSYQNNSIFSEQQTTWLLQKARWCTSSLTITSRVASHLLETFSSAHKTPTPNRTFYMQQAGKKARWLRIQALSILTPSHKAVTLVARRKCSVQSRRKTEASLRHFSAL